ncbi:hypothetical protein Tco_0016952 [Tanacetum coccineum]
MSLINPFNIDDIPVYIPGFSSSIPTVREDSSVEEVMTLTKKPAKRRNKRTVQNDEEVWCIPWTIEEEIALCKGYRSLDWSTPRKDDGDETGDQDEGKNGRGKEDA